MDNKNIDKVVSGYNKFRKFTTGNSLEDLTAPKKPLIELVKDKLMYYIIGFIVLLFINWKITVAIIVTIIFAMYFEKFMRVAKNIKNEVEEEVKNKRDL